jgi:hypothetical protein
MPPQPTLAIRNFSFFHGSLRCKWVTVLNANGVASEANTNERRVICIHALNKKSARPRSGRAEYFYLRLFAEFNRIQPHKFAQSSRYKQILA